MSKSTLKKTLSQFGQPQRDNDGASLDTFMFTGIGLEHLVSTFKEIAVNQIPKSVDPSKYSFEDSAQDFMLGYTQACIEIERGIKAL